MPPTPERDRDRSGPHEIAVATELATLDARVGHVETEVGRLREQGETLAHHEDVAKLGERVTMIEHSFASAKGWIAGAAVVLSIIIPILTALADRMLGGK